MATQIDTSTASADATATPAGASLVVAPSDASLMALYFGTNGPVLATAQAPYAAWARQAIGAASTRNSQAMTGHAGDDGLDIIVTSPSNGPFYFSAARSVNSWTLTQHTSTGDANNAAGATGASMMAGIDPQGRLWYVGLDDVLATYAPAAGDFNGTAWTIDTTLETNGALGEQNHRGIAAAIVGGFLVVVFDAGGGSLKYLRRDVSQAALGAWSAATFLAAVADVSTSSTLSFKTIPGTSTALLVHSGGDGIDAQVYNAVADTWGAVTNLSATVSDRHPCVIPGAAGVAYAVWASFSAANSYGITGLGLRSGVWDSGTTTLEAAGTNIAWPNGAYIPSTQKMGLVWTAGTASPWSIQFDNVTPPPPPVVPTSTGEPLPYFPHHRFIHRL